MMTKKIKINWSLAPLVSWLLGSMIRRRRWLERAIIVLALLAASSLAYILLFRSPQPEDQKSSLEVSLDTAVIDDLEFWIEERQQQADQSFPIENFKFAPAV